jgi:hypothetical protein
MVGRVVPFMKTKSGIAIIVSFGVLVPFAAAVGVTYRKIGHNPQHMGATYGLVFLVGLKRFQPRSDKLTFPRSLILYFALALRRIPI